MEKIYSAFSRAPAVGHSNVKEQEVQDKLLKATCLQKEGKHQEAFNICHRLASQGSAMAKYKCGEMLKEHPELSHHRASFYLRAAADAGVVNAYVPLGDLFMQRKADGEREDSAAAVGWYTKAAELGIVDAYIPLADAYLQGNGVEVNVLEAIRWYLKYEDVTGQTITDLDNDLKAFSVDTVSHMKVEEWVARGKQYLDGETSRNAFICFQMAASMGSSEGLEYLGKMYEKEGDFTKATECFQRAFEKGNVSAQAQLVRLHYSHKLQWAKKQGTSEAWVQTGKVFEKGNEIFPPDFSQALECYNQAMSIAREERGRQKIGRLEAQVAIQLAKIYAPDKLNNSEEMIRYYKIASTHIMYVAVELADMFHYGLNGIPANHAEALQCYQKILDFLKNPYLLGHPTHTAIYKNEINQKIRELLQVTLSKEQSIS